MSKQAVAGLQWSRLQTNCVAAEGNTHKTHNW